MTRPLPPYAVLLGLAGLLPFVLCSVGALALPDDAAGLSLLALTAYGATILAFLGGVHWGFALDGADVPTARTQQLRFGLGVVPSLVGWLALLVVFAGLPTAGLLVLVAGFVATTGIEAMAARRGLMPRPYMRLRWALSAGVIVCLLSVGLVRAFGGRVIL
ncbi:MAG: DUF3429 domain-containing protein [Gemmatimonadaceae bacterium]|nr:DUF3429 domain-containing protein [Acetobacteraceae bacterium]